MICAGEFQVTLQWLSGDVPVIFRWCSGDHQVMLRWWWSDTQVMFKWNSSDIQVIFRWQHKDSMVILWWFLGDTESLAVKGSHFFSGAWRSQIFTDLIEHIDREISQGLRIGGKGKKKTPITTRLPPVRDEDNFRVPERLSQQTYVVPIIIRKDMLVYPKLQKTMHSSVSPGMYGIWKHRCCSAHVTVQLWLYTCVLWLDGPLHVVSCSRHLSQLKSPINQALPCCNVPHRCLAPTMCLNTCCCAHVTAQLLLCTCTVNAVHVTAHALLCTCACTVTTVHMWLHSCFFWHLWLPIVI